MTGDPVPYTLWRIVVAFVLAPLTGAFAFSCWNPGFMGLESHSERVIRSTITVVFFAGSPAALMLGVPAFLILKNRARASMINCALTGAIVASLPWLLLVLLSSPDEASSGGHVTAHEGAKTWWGWLEALEIVGQSIAFGALGGAIFWMVAAAGSGRSK